VADIASVMGCAEGTVKATLHRALANLRVDLDGSDE
jgi:DNA-directed RNA polymerase specialized sigma24 family protein